MVFSSVTLRNKCKTCNFTKQKDIIAGIVLIVLQNFQNAFLTELLQVFALVTERKGVKEQYFEV